MRKILFAAAVALLVCTCRASAETWVITYGTNAPWAFLADYDGDGSQDFSTYYPTTAQWNTKQSNPDFTILTAMTYGWSAVKPVAGDYDGDGKADHAVYWQDGGTWYVSYSGGGSVTRSWGWSSANPVPADYDGDGKTDIAVFYPDGGTWYISYSGGGTLTQNWGWNAVKPVPGDYDGDGKADIAVYWPEGGTWYIRYSSGGTLTQIWGWSEASPVQEDYDGDGKTDMAVYYPPEGQWYILKSSGGSETRSWGFGGTIGVPGDFGHDGKANLCVVEKATGKWYTSIDLKSLTIVNSRPARTVAVTNAPKILGKYEAGARLFWSIPSPDVDGTEHRYAATPASGNFVITSNTALTINWQEQYLLSVSVMGAGTVTPATGGWYNATAEVPFAAQPAAGNVFVYWSVGGVRKTDSNGRSSTALVVTMSQARSVSARFVSETADTDSDGILDWREYLTFGDLAHSALTDADSDGTNDAIELSLGTDPLSAASRPASISGVVNYTGPQNGTTRVIAVEAAGSWSVVYSATSSISGAYTIAGIPNLASYHVKAWRDSNSNGIADSSEAQGCSVVNPICLDTNLEDVVITMANPDTDGDGMPDWFEINYFNSPTAAIPTVDSDNDGLSNLAEYQNGVKPTSADTDGDGLSDGWEVAHGVDPSDYSDQFADPDGDGFMNVYEWAHTTDPNSAASVPAANIHVSLTGGNVAPYGTWEAAAVAIQDAIDVASDYDIIVVADGTYVGVGNRNINFAGKKITVVSEHGWQNCIIDCKNAGEGFMFTDPTTRAAVIDGLTIRNGAGPYESGGGGICIRGDSSTSTDISPTVRNCLITACSGQFGGGVEMLSGCAPALINCIIVNNTAVLGGGGIDMYGMSGSPLIQNCTIAYNSATTGHSAGYAAGGIADVGETAIVQNCILWGNTPYQMDGGASVEYCDIQDGWPTGTGIIANDPLLTDGWRLGSQSPCIDAGTANPVMSDLEGDFRCDDPAHANAVSVWDIGADEYKDVDGDGLPDWWEQSCFGDATSADPTLDNDHDGLTTLQEYETGTNPDSLDTDADGMTDGWEISHGLNPFEDDSSLDHDHDGLLNLDEFRADMDPQTANSSADVKRFELWARRSDVLRVSTTLAPQAITLSWEPVAGSAISISRRPIGAQSASGWEVVADLPAYATGYTDVNMAGGSCFEYRVRRTCGDSYVCASAGMPLTEFRGKVILLVDSSLPLQSDTELRDKLDRLQMDLIGDGWTVLRHDVSPSAAVAEVKALITADYQTDPQNTRSVFLFGKIPVPYSGWLSPDLHGNRAFPADVYYGDMDGGWTDTTNFAAGALSDYSDIAVGGYTNVAGDGRFDQSIIPSPIELDVGRVDLSDMPSFGDEVLLLKRYLDKDHNFRHRAFKTNGKAFVDASSVLPVRNCFPMIVGEENVLWRPWHNSPHEGKEGLCYLFARGGETAVPTVSVQLGSAGTFAANQTRAVFTMIFGSYIGWWKYPDVITRAPLAAEGYGLTCVWAGGGSVGMYGYVQYWLGQTLSCGETLGNAIKRTHNERLASANANQAVYLALMGDPTLRIHPVAPPTDMWVQRADAAAPATLNWLPPTDEDGVVGYNVYRALSVAGPYERVNQDVVKVPCFIDTTAPAGQLFYMVRTIKLQEADGSTYYNASQGTFASIPGANPFDASLSQVPDQNVTANSTIGPLPFTIGGGIDQSTLVLTAYSSNPEVIPQNNIVLGAVGNQRTILITGSTGFGEATITIVAHNGAGAVATSFRVVVPGDLLISEQPHSVMVAPGGDIHLRVEASACPDAVSYQWMKNDVALDGATMANLYICNAQSDDSGQYKVIVTAGAHVLTSDMAVVTVTNVVKMYVSKSTPTHIRPYASPETAADTIQAALQACLFQQLVYDIEVKQGTYVENVTNVVQNGTSVRIHGEDPADWSVVTNTIIDGGHRASVITLGGGEGREFVIEGLTVANGYANALSGDEYWKWTNGGGGIKCDWAGPTIRRCFIVGNSTAPLQPACALEGGWGGGVDGIYMGLVEDCIFTGNSALSDGGAIWTLSDTTIRNCLFEGNSAGGNSAAIAAGGMDIIENCTIVDNHVTGGGCVAAVSSWCDPEGGPTVKNCVIWSNTVAQNPLASQIGSLNSQVTISATHSCIQDLASGGDGNIADDPLFVDAAGGNYELQITSPCFNAGENQAWMSGACDLKGGERIIGDVVDMGALERVNE